MLLQLDPESTINAYATYNSILRRVAQSQKVPFVDVRSVVPSDNQYWGDATHFLEPGSTITAKTISEAIITNGFIQ